MAQKLSHMNYIAQLCKKRGLKKKSTEALLANIKAESGYNPNAIQAGLVYGTGYGLVQMSVGVNISRKDIAYLQSLSVKDNIKVQMKGIFDNDAQWIRRGDYPMTYHEFKINAKGYSRRKLCIAFMQQFERPAWQTIQAGNSRWYRWLPDYLKLKW